MNSLSKICPCIVLAIGLFAVGGSTAKASDDVNVMCPVLSDRTVLPEISTMYKGKEVRFCCNECKVEFEDNPEVYVSELPQLKALSIQERVSAFMDGNTRFVVCGALIAVLVILRIVRFFRPVRDNAPQSFLGKLFSRGITPTIPLLVGVAILGYQKYELQTALAMKDMEDNLHFATFYDFGYPPAPKRPDTEKRVKGSFYRGNDERSPRLFNDGNYRTATFHVSLCSADGSEINHGDEVLEQELFVRLVIERPPFTPDFLYCDKVMNKMFLTRECETFLGMNGPVADRVNLNQIEPMQEWDALFPIGDVAQGTCCDRKQGIVYICEEYYYQPYWWGKRDQRGGSRFHYGIKYDISFEDGKLSSESDVYMGALYRTRKFPQWKVPMDQWFSHNPIPELPCEPSTDDPELLGIDEHLAKAQNN